MMSHRAAAPVLARDGTERHSARGSARSGWISQVFAAFGRAALGGCFVAGLTYDAQLAAVGPCPRYLPLIRPIGGIGEAG